MSSRSLRWRPRRLRAPLALRPRLAAFRADTDDAPEPTPTPATPSPPPAASPPKPKAPAPEPPPPLTPMQPKLMLYVCGVVIGIIVLVIMALGSRAPRRALAYMPVGQSAVQVVDMKRFARGPVYRILSAADHSIARDLEQLEEDWDISPKRDIDLVADGDDITVLIGRFRPARLREAFENAIETRQTRLNAPGRPVVDLKLVERSVDGHDYLLCLRAGIGEAVDREANIIAIAAVRSSLICIGRRGLGVRRFLRTYAGLRDPVLKDPRLAAAYDRHLAKRAFLRRLEKPDGLVLKGQLTALLGDAGAGLQAAFFALTCSDEAIGITIRLAANGPKAAQRLEAQLATPENRTALAHAIGPGAKPTVTRTNDIVTVEAELDLATFEVIVLNDNKAAAAAPAKKPQPSNLVLALLAG